MPQSRRNLPPSFSFVLPRHSLLHNGERPFRPTKTARAIYFVALAGGARVKLREFILNSTNEIEPKEYSAAIRPRAGNACSEKSPTTKTTKKKGNNNNTRALGRAHAPPNNSRNGDGNNRGNVSFIYFVVAEIVTPWNSFRRLRIEFSNLEHVVALKPTLRR